MGEGSTSGKPPIAAERLRSLFDAAESERRRLARELHDGPLQELGALRMTLDAAARQPELRPEDREAILDRIDRAILTLQLLIVELRPSALDDLGLAPALESLGRRSRERFEVEVSVDVELALAQAEPQRLPRELEATISRVAQQGLASALERSNTTRVSITVTRSDGEVEVIIKDDGAGFDPAAPGGDPLLARMRERVAITGGHLEIDSAPGRGTRVLAVLPSANPAQAV